MDIGEFKLLFILANTGVIHTFSWGLLFAVLTGEWCFGIVVLMGISLIVHDIEHLSMPLLAIHVSPPAKSLQMFCSLYYYFFLTLESSYIFWIQVL